MKKLYLYFLGISILLLLTSVVWGKDPNFKSNWRQADIIVDGNESEWAGSFIYLEEIKIGIGIKNDGDNLYVILKTTDANKQRQIMRMGLTIWLDATGKKKKNLGIHYPIGMQAYGMPSAIGQQSDEPNNELKKQFTEMLKEVEILGPEKNDRNRVPRINNFGIEVSLNDTLGVMIYELKIPLKSTKEFPYAVGANAADIISLGLETGEFNREMMRGERPPGRRGERPPGGRPPGERGERPSGGRGGDMMPEPIKFWAKVALASATVNKN
jgi:hypothetical protein